MHENLANHFTWWYVGDDSVLVVCGEGAVLGCSAIPRQPVARAKQASIPWPKSKNVFGTQLKSPANIKLWSPGLKSHNSSKTSYVPAVL